MRKHKTITATQVLELIKRQNFICAISGRTLTPETASLDHIIPLGRGGPHSLENVWAVDHRVNVAKGTMTFDEFVAMCKEIAAYQASKACSEVVAEERCTT
jgi:5-methylcytosine-specific restriction endonuclease McrA